MTNENLHPLTKKIWCSSLSDAWCYQAGVPSQLIQSSLNQLILDYLESIVVEIKQKWATDNGESIEKYDYINPKTVDFITLPQLRKLLSLPEKKSLEEELAEVLDKEYLDARECTPGKGSVEANSAGGILAKAALEFLKERNLLKDE